jgi:hypothetical protein
MAKFGLECAEWPGLAKVAEEAAEVQQVIMKIIAFDGATVHLDGTDLLDKLEEELADLQAAIHHLRRKCRKLTCGVQYDNRFIDKINFFEKIHDNGGPI